MLTQRPFAQVDVFSDRPYLGNPVAVVLDAAGLSDEEMQRFAAWTNLSETTFVLPGTTPDADYRLRIFTPSIEMPFAGHPTLGSAHAWLEHGGVPQAERIVQECGAGLVEIRRDHGSLSFAAPPLRRDGDLDPTDVGRFIAAFGIEADTVVGHQWVDNGPGWMAIQLKSAQDVLDLQPDLSQIPDAKVGVVGMYPVGSPDLYEIRAFAPGAGVDEDPVTGSLNASVAQWLTRTGQVPTRYTASQGACVGRRGRITIDAEPDGTVWVGGATTTCVRGTVAVNVEGD